MLEDDTAGDDRSDNAVPDGRREGMGMLGEEARRVSVGGNV